MVKSFQIFLEVIFRIIGSREFYQNDIEYCSEFITSNFKAHIITMKDRETDKVIKVQVADGEMLVIPNTSSTIED